LRYFNIEKKKNNFVFKPSATILVKEPEIRITETF